MIPVPGSVASPPVDSMVARGHRPPAGSGASRTTALSWSFAELIARVAAILLLLYAQPFTKIAQLTVDDILADGDEVLIRFGEPPTPVPEPFAGLVLRLRDQRPNMRTATNPTSTWLFPGRRAGQPLHPASLGHLVKKAGVPSVGGRIAALRQLVLQAPAPVIADALGITYRSAHHHYGQAGGTWSHYAPGDHSR